jgi:hypothetical protein
VALAWAILAIAYVVRSAFVAAYAETNLSRAESLWPDHPSVRSARAMLGVAKSAANGRPLDRATRALSDDVARTEPLAPQPFVIAGAEAQRNRDLGRAERLLTKARQRDPRGPAARFLLAQIYVSQGRVREGVPEAAVLGRLVPGSLEPLSQAFARYIESAGIPDGMADVMRSNPALSERILGDLSTNSANADLLLRIEALNPKAPGPAPGWQTRLINELVEDGDFSRARQVWAKLSGRDSDPSETIHDPRFEGSNAPPPFNWTFASQGAVIEQQSGNLRVLYFGRDDVALASQLLVLRPGAYRLRMVISGQMADSAIRWRMTCLPDKSLILDQAVAQPGPLDLPIQVPAGGCGAQQLSLIAQANESGSSSDFAISGFSLTAAAR